MTDREIMHKLLDRILDTNGLENEAIWAEYTPGSIGGRATQVTFRLRIHATKDVTYTEL